MNSISQPIKKETKRERERERTATADFSERKEEKVYNTNTEMVAEEDIVKAGIKMIAKKKWSK